MSSNSRKISMKDIARELNISITTVSFVVNGKSEQKSISPATVKKVKDLIEKWGFNPNSAARMLRTGKSKTIGLIVEDISNYFFGNIAKVIELEAHKMGYNIFFSSTENNDDTARKLIDKMKNSSVDGFVITATKGLKNELIKLKKENIPFVLIDRLVPGVEANYVVLDNYEGAASLTQHLLNNGYTKIAFVSIFGGMSQMMDREQGYTDTMAAAGQGVSAGLILKVGFGDSDETVITAIQEFIVANPLLDALFFATNYLGVAGLEALQRSNLSIPTDIAVVCFDDNDIFRLFTPAITVVAQPVKEIATHTINLLLKIIEEGDILATPVGTIISPAIINRDSCPQKVEIKMIG